MAILLSYWYWGEKRLANIVIGYRYDRSPVYVRDEVEGALALVLKDTSGQI